MTNYPFSRSVTGATGDTLVQGHRVTGSTQLQSKLPVGQGAALKAAPSARGIATQLPNLNEPGSPRPIKLLQSRKLWGQAPSGPAPTPRAPYLLSDWLLLRVLSGYPLVTLSSGRSAAEVGGLAAQARQECLWGPRFTTLVRQRRRSLGTPSRRFGLEPRAAVARVGVALRHGDGGGRED